MSGRRNELTVERCTTVVCHHACVHLTMDQKAKLERLGGNAWIRAQLDAAFDPAQHHPAPNRKEVQAR